MTEISTDEAALLAAVAMAPDDWGPRLVHADWLEEHGRTERAVVRVLRGLLVEGHDPALERRLQDMLADGVTCPGPVRTTEVGGELVLLPPGSFLMGDDDSGRVDVTISRGFWIGRTPVTWGSWLMNAGSIRDAPMYDMELPATHADWDRAVLFCEALTERERAGGRIDEGWAYDLPTEAEWEYACRAGTRSPYFFGEDWARLAEHAWYNGSPNADEVDHPRRVAGLQPNPWGLFDVLGNVLEWCRDGFEYEHPGGTDPLVESEDATRVTRGGEFRAADWCCESGSRFGYAAEERRDDLGFRIVLRRT